jgi:AraC-like DNA-binding protein
MSHNGPLGSSLSGSRLRRWIAMAKSTTVSTTTSHASQNPSSDCRKSAITPIRALAAPSRSPLTISVKAVLDSGNPLRRLGERIHESTKFAALFDVLVDRGCPPGEILRNVNLAVHEVHSPKDFARGIDDGLMTACKNAIRLSGDPRLPYRIGTSIHISAYGFEPRMQIALKYLRTTRLANEDIALALGFSDDANFRRAFRRWTNQSPSEIRGERRAHVNPQATIESSSFHQTKHRMSKLGQSMGEMFRAILRLHCRLCPCIEMDRDRTPLSNVCLLEGFTDQNSQSRLDAT